MAKSPFAPTTTRRTPVRPPRLRQPPVLPRGPKYLQQPKNMQPVGWGDPPPGFLSYTNSYSEWVAYWALAKALRFPKDPRQPPFTGSPPLWYYQTPFEGGRVFAGGQVIDFVIAAEVSGHGDIAIRLQTERFHYFTDSVKQGRERLLKQRLAKYFRVVDVNEADLLGDRTGEGAVVLMKQIIAGFDPHDPLRAGTVRRVKDRPV